MTGFEPEPVMGLGWLLGELARLGKEKDPELLQGHDC
jgi:hypothetical protein